MERKKQLEQIEILKQDVQIFIGQQQYFEGKLTFIGCELSKMNGEIVYTGDDFNCENIQPQYDTSIDNELIINVGYTSDVVVKHMNYSGLCIRISYIKAGDKYSMKNIPLGD